MECQEDLDQHKEEMLGASTNMKESHDFETKDSCVYASFASYEDGKPLKATIKEEKNVELSKVGKSEKDGGKNILAFGMKGKCCKFVIGNGSTNNLVSIEMMKKSNLTRTMHLTPYKIVLLHKGHQILVNEQCEVEFQIGCCKYKVLCDIIHKDACHNLLSKPWHYDKKVMHDGRRNTYTFEKHGEKNTLLTLKDEGSMAQISSQVLMMSEKEFLKQDTKEEEIYILPKETDTIVEVINLPLEIIVF